MKKAGIYNESFYLSLG